MKTLYCYLGGSLKDTLHLSDLPVTGPTLFEAQNAADVQTIVRITGAKFLLFYGTWLPQRPVPVNHPQLVKHLHKAFCPPPVKVRPVARVDTNDFDPFSIVDR